MKKNDLLVITSYPIRGQTHGKYIVGGASHTKVTLTHLQTLTSPTSPISLTVLAEKLPNCQNEYKEGGISVKRVWKRKSLKTFPLLLWEIAKNKNASQTVLIQFELAMWGGKLHLLPFPLFVLALRLLGKKVFVVFHHVPDHLSNIHGHINIPKTGWKPTLLTLLFKSLYASLILFSSQAIVFDQALAQRLAQLGSKEKIQVIPLGIESLKTQTSPKARIKLGLPRDSFVLLSFGFTAWYKGTDWMAKAYEKLVEDTNISLILAGGPNPNHLDKPFYTRYVEQVKKECKRLGIIYTGFVDEKDIPLYFAASDLVVFPYRALISASGPLTFTLAAKKPFLFSKPLKSVLESSDIIKLSKKHKVAKKDLIFESQEAFLEKVKAIQKNGLAKKLSNFSADIAKERAWKKIAKQYYTALFSYDS